MEPGDLCSIRSGAWFASLDPSSQRALLADGCRVQLSNGEFVFRQGDPPDGFYGVIRGLLTASSLLADGREVIYGLMEPGDWFGESSSLDGLPRTADIVGLQPTELLYVRPAVFEVLMENARFARAVAVLQAARARSLFSFFEDAAVRTIRARVARRLLALLRPGSDAPVGRHVIPITQETLARMLGITRQTLALELKGLAAAGALSLSYGRITVESVEMLQVLGEP